MGIASLRITFCATELRQKLPGQLVEALLGRQVQRCALLSLEAAQSAEKGFGSSVLLFLGAGGGGMRWSFLGFFVGGGV